MQDLLQEAIELKSRALLAGIRRNDYRASKYASMFKKRTGVDPGDVSSARPSWWGLHPHFNPEYCIKHSKYLSKVIWKKIQSGEYSPEAAVEFDVPKPNGDVRKVMAFTIPDASLANVIHKKATARNISIFSNYSYAYRPDVSIFDAVLNLRRALSAPKVYVVQYDFSKFFDKIKHSYLKDLINRDRYFVLTGAERAVMSAFLEHRYRPYLDYESGEDLVRVAGVPQGSSLSLFLSNVAAHELDMELERKNGSFVRFADDVVAITSTYSDAVEVSRSFRAHCRQSGLEINYRKSPGIQIFGGGLARERREYGVDIDDIAGLETIKAIDYLGHRFSHEGIRLPPAAVSRVKRRISSIIHKHLFLHRSAGIKSINRDRVGRKFLDWDFVTCINEIRNYIYGGLSEDEIKSYLSGGKTIPHVRGLMSFLPMQNKADQLMELDGWLLSVILRAQRQRYKVLKSFSIRSKRLNKEQIIHGSWYKFKGVDVETQLPSFVRAWRASRKYSKNNGFIKIVPPRYYSAVGFSDYFD